MSTAVMSLTEFLLAQIAKDEAMARECAKVYPPPWDVEDRGATAHVASDAPNFLNVTELDQAQAPDAGWLGTTLAHIALHDPARVLAECASKRAIVELHDLSHDPCDAHDPSFKSIPCETLEHLASVYADHPDYLPELKP